MRRVAFQTFCRPRRRLTVEHFKIQEDFEKSFEFDENDKVEPPKDIFQKIKDKEQSFENE